ADVANNSDGLCTLREAITAANNNAASGAVAGECAAGSNSGDDAISFSVTGTINLTSVLPNIASNMVINGPGSALLTVRRSSAGGTPNFPVLAINSNTTVTVSGLTISNGRSTDGLPAPIFGNTGQSGGGISSAGTLTLKDLTVTSNRTGNGAVPSSTDSNGVAFGG